jgi:hypothetical protein
MRHLAVALAALSLLALGALEAFDSGPPLPLVSELVAAPAGAGAGRHSGMLEATSPSGLAAIAPPERFQHDAAAIMIFGHAEVIASLCPHEEDGDEVTLACAGSTGDGKPVIVVPNPCLAAGGDLYAAILCHELGHVNGWPKEHGD